MGFFRRLRVPASTPTPQQPPEQRVPHDAISPSMSSQLLATPPTAFRQTSENPIPASASSSSISRIWRGKKARERRAGSLSSVYALSGPSYANQVAVSSPGRGSVRDDEEATPRGKTETTMFAGQSGVSSPTSVRGPGIPTSLLTDRLHEATEDLEELDGPVDPSGRRGNKVNSGEFKKEGGILGKLGFEREDGTAAAHPPPTQTPLPPAAPPDIEQDGYRDMLFPADQEENDDMATMEADVSVGHEEPGDPMGAPNSSQAGMDGVEGEEVEFLESAQKKNRFWKGKRRMRRLSRAASDAEDDAMSGSPTPRKSSLPPPMPEPVSPIVRRPDQELQQPRPQQLRRPSSSIFRPFARSASRTSLAFNDLEVPPGVDDGSFQLKSFRHVSGTSEMDLPGELDGYLAHVKHQSPADTDQTPLTASPNTSSIPRPPTAFMQALAKPSPRPIISRPPSAAASVVSVDDLINSSTKVSAAAFRKGIRRASEGPTATMSDLGHGGRWDDEDDLPLGVLNKRELVGRHGSSHSLASLSGYEDSGHRLPPKFTLQPSWSPAQPPRDSSTSAFVVKSSRSTRGSLPGDAIRPFIERPASTDQMSTRWISPPRTGSSSPILPDREEVVISPVGTGKNDGYFAIPLPVRQLSAGTISSPAREPSCILFGGEGILASSLFPAPGCQEPVAVITSDLQVASSSRAVSNRSPPSVHPLGLPQPGERSPSLILPLPPDQMPDTPPGHFNDLPPPVNLSSSTPKRGRRLSLLEEPLRVLSGLWSPSTQQEDGFDPTLVVDSMGVFGENGRHSPSIPHAIHKQPATTSLSAAANVSAEGIARPALQARLASVAGAVSRPTGGKPILPRIQTQPDIDDADGHTTEQVRSPASDASTASPMIRNAPPMKSSSSGRARSGVRQKQSTLSREQHARKTSWSSSESGGEESKMAKARVKRVSTRRTPGGPRLQSPRQVCKDRSSQSPQLPQSDCSDVGSSSSEDEVLSKIRANASRSSLSFRNSPMTVPTSLPTSPDDTSTRSKSSTGIQLGPIATAGLAFSKERRPSLPATNIMNRGRGQFTAASISPVPPSARSMVDLPPSHSMTRILDSSTSEAHRTSASPASSVSGLTSDNLGQQLATPREPSINSSYIARSSLTSQSRDSSRDLDHTQMRPFKLDSLSHNTLYGDPSRVYGQSRHVPTSNGSLSAILPRHPAYGEPVPSAPPNMDPQAMRMMMKQHWQAQFMAAAYRASEDEWERASTLTEQPSSSSPSSYPQPHLTPPFQGPPISPAFPMYGYPTQAASWMFPFPPQQQGPYPYPQNAGGGGMYSYGPTAQSAFGGEFGPPPAAPRQSYMKQHQQHMTLPADFAQGPQAQSSSLPTPWPRHEQTRGASPPSTWRDDRTPRTSTLSQSPSQFAN